MYILRQFEAKWQDVDQEASLEKVCMLARCQSRVISNAVFILTAGRLDWRREVMEA